MIFAMASETFPTYEITAQVRFMKSLLCGSVVHFIQCNSDTQWRHSSKSLGSTPPLPSPPLSLPSFPLPPISSPLLPRPSPPFLFIPS